MSASSQGPTMSSGFAAGRAVSDFFDAAAGTYGEGYIGNSPVAHFFRRRMEIVLELLAPFRGGRLLDLGCGPGLMVGPCVERGFTYVGVDISPGMIAECRERHREHSAASFIVGTMQNLQWPDGSFDVVLCMGALEYLSPTAEAQAIVEMTRVLRHDGLLIVCYLNALSLYWTADRWHDRLRSAVARLRVGVRAGLQGSSAASAAEAPAVPFRTFREAACRQLLARSGFSSIMTRFFCMSPLPPQLERRLPRLAVVMSRLLAQTPIKLQWPLAKGFVLAARKQRALATASRFAIEPDQRGSCQAKNFKESGSHDGDLL